MTAEQKEILRDTLLRSLHSAGAVGMPSSTLRLMVYQSGFVIAEEDVTRELDYLEGKRMVRERRATLSAGAKRWVLTAEGTDYLEGAGLV